MGGSSLQVKGKQEIKITTGVALGETKVLINGHDI